MPLYEYHCSECDEQFELLIRGNEKAECPKGCATELEKQLSLTATPSVSGSSLPIADPMPSSGGGSCCSSGCGKC
ncbi:MAG: zinc ribbon domain-containing protein [Planctomycetota bacterium]